MARHSKATRSGYALADAYDALDAAIEKGDLERACCLAAEIAGTPGQAAKLASHLLDVYAQRYACGNLWLVEEMARTLPALGAPEPDMSYRRVMCELVILMCRSAPRTWSDVLQSEAERHQRRRSHGGGGVASDSYADGDGGSDSDGRSCCVEERGRAPDALPARYVVPFRLLRRHLAARHDAPATLSLAGVLLDSAEGTSADVPPPPGEVIASLAARGMILTRASRSDVAWHLWGMVIGASEADGVADTGVARFVHASMALYAHRCAKRTRRQRAPLLLYAVLALLRGRVRAEQPGMKTVALIRKATECVDALFEEAAVESARDHVEVAEVAEVDEVDEVDDVDEVDEVYARDPVAPPRLRRGGGYYDVYEDAEGIEEAYDADTAADDGDNGADDAHTAAGAAPRHRARPVRADTAPQCDPTASYLMVMPAYDHVMRLRIADERTAAAAVASVHVKEVVVRSRARIETVREARQSR